MIKFRIAGAIEEGVKEMAAEAGHARSAQWKIALEHPVQLEHGEYSSSIAMQLAKLLKKAPLQIAKDLKDRLLVHPDVAPYVEKIDAVSPGYLNFFLNWTKWAEEPGRATGGKIPIGDKVIIEHTSINPNKSAHIGHLRNSCIGDTLARMLAKEGHPVEVHNYIDDLGNQLADTVVGLLKAEVSQPFGRFGDFCWETYAGINRAYKERPELLQEREKVLKELEEGHSNIAWLGLLTAERIVREQLEEMKQFRIHYDVLVWESGIVREGFWSSAFELLRNTPIFREETEGRQKGCWVLKHPDRESGGEISEVQSDYQADKVLIRSNGVLTYTAKDIAYHLWKFGLLEKDFRYKRFSDRLWTTHPSGVRKKLGHADMVINVIDQRQEYPQAVVKQALHALGYGEQAGKLKHVSYGVVSLSPETAKGLGIDISDGKHAYAMSGRQGIGIKVSELLDRMEQVIDAGRSRKAGLASRTIAAASIRYYLLRFHMQTEVVFDLEQATEVTGNTGVYLLYSYARACSILEKAKQPAFTPPDELACANLEPQERSLLRQLAYWPDARQTAVRELAPNHLCAYVHELSAKFNHFYAACPILRSEGKQKSLRLWLTERYTKTMQEGLEMLGLPAPRRM